MAMTYGDNTNEYNTALGYNAMRGKGSTNKFNNTKSSSAIGSGSMYNILGGDYNSALGVDASRKLETGLGNVSAGYRSLYHNTDGDYNVALGYQAGYGYNDPGIGSNFITQLRAIKMYL